MSSETILSVVIGLLLALAAISIVSLRAENRRRRRQNIEDRLNWGHGAVRSALEEETHGQR